MSGTRSGGCKAAKTNTKLYGKEFYKIIGSRGGQAKTTKPKGFAANKELARLAGALGGRRSRRTGISTGQGQEREYIWKGGENDDLVFSDKSKEKKRNSR